jgi:hypothetical protein
MIFTFFATSPAAEAAGTATAPTPCERAGAVVIIMGGYKPRAYFV